MKHHSAKAQKITVFINLTKKRHIQGYDVYEK